MKKDSNELNGKFDNFEKQIKQESFRENKGLGNDMGYYIFDYDPEDELIVRERVKNIKNKINNNTHAFKIIEFDIYNIVFDILKEKNYLEKVFEFEKTKGREFTVKAINRLLRLSSDSNLIVNYILDHHEDNAIIFITGVGKIYPIVRSHNVLNNLIIEDTPVVLFYPGKYSGNDLKLFGTIEDTNYYRAFRL